VSWFKVAACPNEAREVECNDTVSTYSLERESGDSPNLGCIVVRLIPSSWSEMKKNVSPADLSWVGHVIDHPDGHVQVKWGDGSISTVRLLYAYIVLDILILGSLELTDFSKTRGECENILEFSAQLHINEK
jgi:hypothetical protein